MKRILLVFLLFCWSVLASTTVSAECTNKCTKGAVPCERIGDYLSPDELNAKWSAHKSATSTSSVPKPFKWRSVLTVMQSRSYGRTARSPPDLMSSITTRFLTRIPGLRQVHLERAATSSDVVIVKDTNFMDEGKQLSLVILRPHLLQEDTTYIVEFYTNKAITKSGFCAVSQCELVGGFYHVGRAELYKYSSFHNW